MTKHERNISEEHTLPRLCNVHTVARELDCGISKVYKMMKAGLLPAVTVEGMVRVPREALEEYIKVCAKNSGWESTEAHGSPSEDAEATSGDVRSALKRQRILGPMHSAKSTSSTR